MHHLIGHLSPVVHPRNWDLIRVPVRRVDGVYVVYVADGFNRIYDDASLPLKLKSRFAMILANNDGDVFEPESKLQKLTIYINNQSPDLDDVGWRVSETYFCLVLDRDTLESMKGTECLT